MSVEIKVPSMGESITEATVAQILKEDGSEVQMDEEIIELETDKVNQVLFAPQGGVLKLSVRQDDVVKIGQVIGSVEASKKQVEKEEPQKPVKDEKEVVKKEEPPPAPKPVKEVKEPIRQEKDAFLTKLMEKPKSSQKQAPKETRRKMSKIRKVIAERLVQAKNSTAMLTTFNEIDMTRVMKLRENYKKVFEKEHGIKLGFMSFFVKACVLALKAIPGLNSYIDGDEIVHRESLDIGIAVSTDRGLMVPVLRDCQDLTFAEVEQEIVDFARKAKEGALSVDDLKGGSFTITNGGVFGSLLSTPILNYPQCGILGMHKIEKRAVVIDDQIVIRPMMYVALSYDHRIVDGKEAVTFLVHVKDSLEDPARMLLGV